MKVRLSQVLLFVTTILALGNLTNKNIYAQSCSGYVECGQFIRSGASCTLNRNVECFGVGDTRCQNFGFGTCDTSLAGRGCQSSGSIDLRPCNPPQAGSCSSQGGICPICTLSSSCTYVGGGSTPTPPPSGFPTPTPGGGGGGGCSGACMDGSSGQNCGTYGMNGGSGSCGGGQICCSSVVAASCRFGLIPNPVVVDQNKSIAIAPANINANGSLGGFNYSNNTNATGVLWYNPPGKAPTCAFDPRRGREVCRAPASGWGTTAYGVKATNGLISGGVVVQCWVIDSGGVNRTFDLQVNPITPPGSSGSTTAWWQVVDGDVFSSSNLYSLVPDSTSTETIYDDIDPAVRYLPLSAPARWSALNDSNAFLFTYHAANNYRTDGSQLTFTGSSITYVWPAMPGYGIADVIIDGVKVDSLNLASSTGQTEWQKEKTYQVTPGTHTIVVNVPVGGDVLDAYRVSSGPTNLNFAVPPTLTGYPGVTFFGGDYDFTADTTSKGTPSIKGWLAQTTINARVPSYDYFASLSPSDTIINQLTSTVDGSYFNTQGTISPDGYYWYKAVGNLVINNVTSITGARKVILLVEGGDLTINGNVSIGTPGSGFYSVFVDGNINVAPGVTSLHGIYFTDGTFLTGAGSTALTVNGTVVANSGVNLQRDLGATNNATSPSEIFQYDPTLLFNFPPSLAFGRTVWREVAP